MLSGKLEENDMAKPFMGKIIKPDPLPESPIADVMKQYTNKVIKPLVDYERFWCPCCERFWRVDHLAKTRYYNKYKKKKYKYELCKRCK